MNTSQATLTPATTISVATLAALADFSCITESLQLAESIVHRWLKTESEKPIPPAPADIQPAVHALWRCSTIRKNLLGTASASTSNNPAPDNPTCSSPAHMSNPPSEASILRAVPTGKLIELATRKLNLEVNSRIKEAESHLDAETQPPATTLSAANSPTANPSATSAPESIHPETTQHSSPTTTQCASPTPALSAARVQSAPSFGRPPPFN